MNQAAEIGSISSISALLAALTAVLGGAVLLSGRRRPAYRAFLFLCGNLLLWHLANVFHFLGGERLTYLALGVLAFLPVSLLGFLRTWLGDSDRRGPPRSAVLLVILIEIGLVYAYSVRHAGNREWATRIPTLVQAATLLSLYGALGPLWRAYRSTVSRVDKRRLLYLIGIGALTISAAALDFLPSPYGRGGPALGSVLTIVYLYFLQQTLFMDRLLDINELLGKVVVLSAFVLLLSAVHTLLTLIGVAQQQVVTVVAFIILLLYEPLRTFLEGQVQRITARERYELQQSLGELRQILPNVIEPREAVRLVLSVFEETRRLTQAAVYLLEPDGAGYELVGHFGSRPVDRLDAAARRPLLARLASGRQPLTLEQLHREHTRLTQGPGSGRGGGGSAADIETLDAIARTLVELQASAVIGIFASSGVVAQTSLATGPIAISSTRPSDPPRDGARGKSGASLGMARESSDALSPGEALLGILCIKDKDPGERVSDAFAAGELDIYAGIAAQLGITLQNSKLYERMKEHDRLAALGQMAAGLAHEIRNPLGAIKGAAELIEPLEGGRVPDDAAEFVGIILEETRRLGRVVSQFLDYARPLRGDFQPVDINDVVRKTVALLRPLTFDLKAETPDTKVTPEGAASWLPPELLLELADDLPQTRGDAEQLRQVFLNLGLNAVQAMADMQNPPEGTRARLVISTGLRHGGRLGTPMQHIEVRFSDNGPGIDPSVQKNLFIPFFTTKDKGTGLGLPISQRIVENHDGFIEVRSRPGSGGGATFTVVLPIGASP
jgi:two-component system sensor histidine kinase HydH